MLFERIVNEIEKEAQKRGVYFPSEENVSIKLDLSKAEKKEWESETCDKIVEVGDYWFEWEENYNTGDYELAIDYSCRY